MSDASLFDAIEADDFARVKDALEKGADVNASATGDYRWTPLMCAASSSSSPEIFKLLLESGAEVNARALYDETPLMYAAMNSSSPEIVTLLLAKGADALAKDEDGMKAIDHAKKNDKLKGTKAYWKLHDKSFE